MKTRKFIAALSAMVIFFIGCEKTAPIDEYPGFDRELLKTLQVGVEGTKSSSSLILTFPSGETHPFTWASYIGSRPLGDGVYDDSKKEFMLLSDHMIINNRIDWLSFFIEYEEPGVKNIAGTILKPLNVNFMWVTSNFSSDSTSKYKGTIKYVGMTKEEVILHFDNVVLTLSDGDYSINGFITVSR